MNRQPWPADIRQQALALYRAAGIEVASEVTTVPIRTIRSWVNGNGGNADAIDGQAPDQRVTPVTAPSGLQDGPVKKGLPRPFRGHGWQPRLLLSRLTAELWEVLEDLGAARRAGKARDAKDLGVLAGIILDKSMELAKVTGHDGGRPDPEQAVAHIHQLLDGIEERRQWDAEHPDG